MRGSGQGVIAAFAIPPGAPPEVLEAQRRFEQIATRYAEREGEISDAKAAVEAAKKQDHAAAVEATLAGEELPVDVNKRERDAASKVEALLATLPALAEATDQAGNALATAIDEGRENWQGDLDAARESASDHYDEALAQAQAALMELSTARGAAAWLARYDAAEARVGQVVAFLGRGPHLIAEDKFGRQSDAAELLALAARVTAPPALPYGDPGRKAGREEVTA